jgi:SecD/SecF fusion protein
VQATDNGENISVRTPELTPEEEDRIRAELGKVGGSVDEIRDELIGPSLGDELRLKALIALGVALLAQMIYLAIRYRWMFGVAAMLTMFHDIVLVVGLFAWLGKSIDAVFLAAALTIIGRSVNDVVVVFDRIREIWGANPKAPFAESANTAVLQTVPRTINTGLGAMFILAALTILGGDSLTDFALALLVGLVVGTYSSGLTSPPLAIALQSKWPSRPPKAKTRVPESVARKRAQRASSGARV